MFEYTNLFSPNVYKKNDKTIYKHFEDKYVSSLDKKKHSNRISENYKKSCKYLNCAEHLIILASLVCVPVGIMSSAVEIKVCGITAEEGEEA